VFLDQAVVHQAAQPVVERLPQTFRLLQSHKFEQLITGSEPRPQYLLE
jgi:hypothetical protein